MLCQEFVPVSFRRTRQVNAPTAERSYRRILPLVRSRTKKEPLLYSDGGIVSLFGILRWRDDRGHPIAMVRESVMNFEAVASSLREDARASVTEIDLDASATTAPTPGVIAAVVAAMSEGYGNPSSGHGRGDAARRILADARDAVNELISGASEDGVTFTSGCTEANNLVLRSFAGAPARIITTAVEHPSVIATVNDIRATGGLVTILGVDGDGGIDLTELRTAVNAASGPCLVSIQLANSETGILQDARAIAAIVSGSADCFFHADAAQAVGKIDLTVGRGVGPDVVTLSGHKLHAPMGIGAVVVAADSHIPLQALLRGGEQEHGLRAGTEAVPAIAGLAAACQEWAGMRGERQRTLTEMQSALEARLAAIDGAIINGAASPRLPNVTNVRFAGIDAMALVANLDARGIYVSQGSACSSRRPEPSPVLVAMGLSEGEAFSAIRLSLSVHNQASDVDLAARAIAEIVAQMRGGL